MTSPHRPAPSLRAYDVGLLVIRLAIGVILFAHGTQKLFGWFGGGGVSGTGQFFTMSGYPAGEAFAVVAGLTETLGGIGLALGLLTPLAGAAALGTMINAMAVAWGGGFFAPNGYEFPLLMASVALGLALTGPGRLAVDRFLPFLRSHRLVYGVAAVALAGISSLVILLIRG
ncbi:DoxX family protein [Streptomyces sp. LaPpAH-108]|uniref:DoxX family protein n=1 Tax=Streptomyces sp. LaPpAH-108 TaxID=1155714 RepID=UPI0005638311|nr:DoxX family protein [Streptomyces sp. LaPpAH-108]